jgi:hypothetical protein
MKKDKEPRIYMSYRTTCCTAVIQEQQRTWRRMPYKCVACGQGVDIAKGCYIVPPQYRDAWTDMMEIMKA